MTHSEKEFNPKRKVYFMLKELILQHNYRLDTYLACLKTLERMSGFFEHTQCRLMAIAILLSVAKLHEFRTPKYLNLLRWANCAYSTAELTVA